MARHWLIVATLLLCLSEANAADIQRSGAIVNNGDIIQIQAIPATTGSIQIGGTWTGTIQFEGTLNGTDWVALTVVPFAGGAGVTSATANGAWVVNNSLMVMRLRASAAMTGTANVFVVLR